MQIKVLEKSKDGMEAHFTLEGSMPVFANTVRRLFLEEVPTMAIEEVEFKDNSSILYDETVAHRLGLLPIKADLGLYKLREEVEGGGIGSAECELKITCAATGPCTVYAEDLKIADPSAKMVQPRLPVAKLIKDQKIEFEATAILGRGKEHMKWAPGHIYYTYEKKKSEDASVFHMHVESWGQLSCKEALLKAMDVLDNKMDAFAKVMKEHS